MRLWAVLVSLTVMATGAAAYFHEVGKVQKVIDTLRARLVSAEEQLGICVGTKKVLMSLDRAQREM